MYKVQTPACNLSLNKLIASRIYGLYLLLYEKGFPCNREYPLDFKTFFKADCICIFFTCPSKSLKNIQS